MPCAIPDCDADVFCRGWCVKHYTRWQRHGDPGTTTRTPPMAAGVTEKKCPRCANTKSLDEFDQRPNGKPKGYCRECEARYQRQYSETPHGRERLRLAKSKWNAGNHAYFLMYRYGLTAERYAEMLDEQGGKCAICGASEPGGRDKVWHVDHCHNSNEVRGLLCGACNRGLGQFKDDPGRLRSAADYLESMK